MVLAPEGPQLGAIMGRGARGTGADFSMALVRDRANTPKIVPVTWHLSGIEYDYWMAFFRRETYHGVRPFLIDLPLQGSALTTHKACFVPNSISITAVAPIMYSIAAQLLTVPA